MPEDKNNQDENQEELVNINIFPFVVECWSLNKKIYKDIDRLYKKDRYRFYDMAKQSEFYNSPLTKEKSLLQEQYYRKSLGILLVSLQDEAIMQEAQKIMKKGWPKSYSYIQSHENIVTDDFLHKIIKSIAELNSLSDNEINNNIIILYFWCNILNKKVVYDEGFKIIYKMLTGRLGLFSYYQDGSLYSQVTDEIKIKVKKIQNKINFTSYNNINFRENKRCDAIGILFDTEGLDFTDMIEGIRFTDNDIKEIIISYLSRYNYDLFNIEHIKDYIYDAMYIKYLLKAYKEAKKVYFNNNVETTFMETELLENNLSKTMESLKFKERELFTANERIEQLEKENTRLQKQLADNEKNKQELNSLREFMFNLDKQEEFQDNNSIDLEKLKDKKAIIIGGHVKWQQRMKEFLPNFIFISPDNLNYDVRILDNIDIIFVYVNYLNHAIYYKMVNAIDIKDKRIVYINQQNENMVLNMIYNIFYNNK